MAIRKGGLRPAWAGASLLLLLLHAPVHHFLGHALHRIFAYGAALEKVGPDREHAEVQRRDRPHHVHNPHLLWMLHFVDGDNGRGRESNRKRCPGEDCQNDDSCKGWPRTAARSQPG